LPQLQQKVKKTEGLDKAAKNDFLGQNGRQ
jgi:hypothetical protein